MPKKRKIAVKKPQEVAPLTQNQPGKSEVDVDGLSVSLENNKKRKKEHEPEIEVQADHDGIGVDGPATFEEKKKKKTKRGKRGKKNKSTIPGNSRDVCLPINTCSMRRGVWGGAQVAR